LASHAKGVRRSAQREGGPTVSPDDTASQGARRAKRGRRAHSAHRTRASSCPPQSPS
jgi:hypothetical protein